MIISIHQAHFFPWLGYLDKIVKSDKFVILDEVQLELGSPMVRNELIDNNGNRHYINVNFLKKNFLEKKANEIEVFNGENWQRKLKNFIFLNYKKAPFFDEIFSKIEFIFDKEYKFLIDVQMDTISAILTLFNISTPIVLQSQLNLKSDDLKNNDLIIEICKKLGANQYLSGNGAKKYMDLKLYEENEIEVFFQKFTYPQYNQFNTQNFQPNLSCLDLLFNYGCDGARDTLVKNIEKEK